MKLIIIHICKGQWKKLNTTFSYFYKNCAHFAQEQWSNPEKTLWHPWQKKILTPVKILFFFNIKHRTLTYICQQPQSACAP